MPIGVAFESVSKSFGEVHAVRDLTLAAEEGEFLVLVGPSGCGKTTALRMVAGLEMPTAGEISIAGRDVTYLEPRERDIAMVFQSYALYPHMTVEDNLAFGLKQRKTPRAEVSSRVAEAARMLEIEHLLKRRPRELSGGQRQRVALGRAIVRRPKVFLMDEPLSNLDAQLRLRTRGELSRLHRQLSTTFMYVTHDQVEAMTMGTRIAVMNGGLLQQLDTPAALYARPANTFVAAFIGSPAMNLIEGEVTLIGEAFAFVSSICALPLPNTPGLAEIAGRRITLGLRPEDFDRTPAAGREGGIGGEVELVEPLGSDQFVTIEADGAHLTARVDPAAAITLGSRITLIPDTSRAHYFDTATGTRLDAQA